MQSLSLFALLLEIAPAVASISPFMRFGERSWTPARETATATRDGELDGLMSPPAPTEAPGHPEYAGVELFKRFEMGTDTCGFASGYKSEPWTCVKIGAFCASTGTVRGCCVGSTPDCFSTFTTTCINYSDAPSSSCGTGTMCCGSSSPSCFTWRYSTTATPGTTYSAFNCYTSGGVGTLLDVPPGLATSTGSSTNPNSPTTDSSTTTTQPADSGGSQAPVGAIVGGVVGGLAVIGIAVIAIFWLVVRHRRQAAAGNGGTAPSTMGGGGAGSHMSYNPQPAVAPLAGTHQSNVYTFPQDANNTAPRHLSTYSNYAGYYAGEQGKPGYDPNLHTNQMAQQGVQGLQPQYTGTSDGAWTANTHGTHATQPSQPISELPSTQQQRAELG